jgi:hypothetical protein
LPLLLSSGALPFNFSLVDAPLPLPLPLKFPLVDAVVTLTLASGIVSLAAATKAFSGKGPSTLFSGTLSLSPAKIVRNYYFVPK